MTSLSLPPALFTLHRLCRLLLAGNLLEELPAEVKALQLLTELDLSGNRLENLPPALFSSCLELRILNVSHNSLSSLPEGIAASIQALSCVPLFLTASDCGTLFVQSLAAFSARRPNPPMMLTRLSEGGTSGYSYKTSEASPCGCDPAVDS
uniref:Uncharacterized protein n=1 Tax=Mastacembelus armatus TaxID=205130 RepID=A0A7N8WY52_9TELE